MKEMTDSAAATAVREGVRRRLGFPKDSVVDVEEIEGDESRWTLLRQLDYQPLRQDPFHVPVGQTTDFASVPRVFVWLLPRYGRYTKAAILHDYLWGEEVPAGRIKRLDADGIFRQAMRGLGVPFVRRWMMWAAVRWGALVKPDGWKDWWKEGWRVLPITLLAIPIVGPPAAVILVALVAFWVLEVIAWVPLRIGLAIRRKTGRRIKQVNFPRFGLKL